MNRPVNLSSADLSGRDLTGASYRGVAFRKTNLERANLRETDCREADFRGANLRRAVLDGADLRNADFRGADLAAASLIAAKTEGARFEGAEMRGALLYKSYEDAKKAPVVPRLRTELPFITGTGLAFTSDGRYLAIAGPSFGIALWDTIAEAPVRHFNGHRGTTLSVAITPDDAYLVSGSADETVRLWSMNSDDVHVFRGHTDSVLAVAVAKRRPLIVSGGADQTVQVWSIAKREPVAELRVPRDVVAVAIAERPLRVIALLDGGQVFTWTHLNGAPAVLRGVRNASTGAISPSGRYVAHGTDGRGRALVRRVADGTVVLRTPPHVDLVNLLLFTPDSRYLLASSADGEPRLWPVGGQGEPTTIGVQASFVAGAAFGPNGLVATAEGFGGVNVRQDGRVVSTLRGHGSEIFAVHLSDDGKTLVTGSADGHVHILELNGEPEVRHVLLPHGERRLEAVAMTSDGALIATAGSDRRIVLIDGPTGQPSAECRTPAADITTLAFLSEKAVIAGDEAGFVTMYRVPSLEVVYRRHVVSHNGVLELAASESADLLAVIGWSRILLVHSAWSGERRSRTRLTHRPSALAIHPRGRLIAVGQAGGALATYDLESTHPISVHRHHRASIRAIGFSTDGSVRTSCDREGVLTVTNQSATESLTQYAHTGELSSVASLSDGRMVAAGCDDGTVAILIAKEPVVSLLLSSNHPLRHFSGQPTERPPIQSDVTEAHGLPDDSSFTSEQKNPPSTVHEGDGRMMSDDSPGQTSTRRSSQDEPAAEPIYHSRLLTIAHDSADVKHRRTNCG